MEKSNVLDSSVFDDCKKCSAWSGTDCTRIPYKDGCLLDKKIGMYDETPKITIGKFTICEMTIPVGDSIWIQEQDEEGGEFKKDGFEPFLKEFFDKNF